MSCSTSGHFTSNPRDRMAFAGREFVLTKSDSFHLRSWTDSYYVQVDSNGSIIHTDRWYKGVGTYECIKDSIVLSFSNSDSIIVNIDFSQDSLSKRYDISISDELGGSSRPGFEITNEDNEILYSEFFWKTDTCKIVFAKDVYPRHLNLNSFFSNRIEKPIVEMNSLRIGSNTTKIKSYNGYYPKGQKVIIWFRPTITGIRYKFDGQKKRYLPRKWRFNAINKLYRDY